MPIARIPVKRGARYTALVLAARAFLVTVLLSGAARADEVTPARAVSVLYGNAGQLAPPGCAADDVRCLVAVRYARWPAAQRVALALYDQLGDVAGVEVGYAFDGGYRGVVRLVPALPVGDGLKHLTWVLAAQLDIEVFVAALATHASAPLAYRHRGLAWRFLRSVGKRTPSAYALDWEVGYNLNGSLNVNADSVRDTLFHEIFHLNDAAHDAWSGKTLGPLVAAIVAKCGMRADCLAPYAPMATKVKKTGTYYAFQPDNGDMVAEYAAELASRYFNEQRAMLRGGRPSRPAFKCLTPENAEAWSALAAEFFAGVDLVPDCR